MTPRVLLASILSLCALLAATPALAADPAEISFWESVRDSKDPAELRAYLQQYPDGSFAVLARRRLATLESGALPAAAQPAAPTKAWTLPQAGDSWTYRWVEKKPRGTPIQRTLAVSVVSSSGAEIVDAATIDGATPPLQSKHQSGSHLIAQGASVFSPYLPVFAGMPAGTLWRVQMDDPACLRRLICDAKGRIFGREIVRTPAGEFNAVKVVIEQSWRSAVATSFGDSGGGRTLTAWYAPEAKRAVKYVSRTTFGQYPPIEADFEIELVSFKVN